MTTFAPALFLALAERLTADTETLDEETADDTTRGSLAGFTDALALLRESVASAARLITMNRAVPARTDFDRGYAAALAAVAELLNTGTLPART